MNQDNILHQEGGTNSRSESAWLKKYNAQEVELPGGTVEVIDVAPKHLTSTIPILYAPGWNPDAQVLRLIMPEITKAGRRGIALCAPHGIDVPSDDAETRKTQAVLSLLDVKKLEKIDAIGHSEAGLYLVEAALKEPEKFRSILLVNPAGVIGPDSLPNLAARFVKGVTLDVLGRCRDLLDRGHLQHSRLLRHIVRGSKSGLSSHAPKEVEAMSSRQIPEKLRTLREMGIHICIVQTKDDKAFPASRRMLSPADYDELIEIEQGGHNFPLLEPEKFMPIALQAFDRLAEKKS